MTGVATPLYRHRSFRTLWLARLVSFAGDSLALVALIVYLATQRDDEFAVAALLIVGDLAPMLLSPWTATLSDRLSLRKLMIVCELLQALLIVAAVVVIDELAPLLFCVFLRSLVAQTNAPASQAAIARLVDDEQLETANAAIGFGTFGLEALGAALAALLIPQIGTRGVLIVDAASFVLAAVLLVRLPPLAALRAPASRTIGRDAREGLRFVWRAPMLRAVVTGFALFVTFIAIDDVALAFLGTRTFHASRSATSLLYAGAGIGMLVGFVALMRRSSHRPAWLLVTGFALAAAGNLLTGLAWALGVVFAMQVVRGVGVSLVDVGSATLLQRTVPKELLGRAFGNLRGAVGLAAGVSYVAGGLLLQATSPRAVFVVAGCGGLATAAWTSRALVRASGDQEARTSYDD